jgi:hypothetical protein
MKKILFPIVILLFSLSSQAQLDGLLKKANTVLNNGKTSGLSSEDIVSGLKEALSVGAQKSSNQLSSVDGFFKDAVIKILMPEEAKKVESKLRMLGMGDLVDNAILSMNRAAEDASKSAAPIFLNAIKSMTIKDGLNILKGSDTAATGYLRSATTVQLVNAFKPIIEESLKKVNATKYWNDVFSAYNKVSFKKVDTDLSSYVTTRALNGLFYYVAVEEKNIRKDPAARVSDILKKVFGS